MKNVRGFSLVELLVYVGITALAAGALAAILMVVARINKEESASVEVTSQLNFVSQTVNRLVRESSNVETASGNTLKLRMKDSSKDPTCVYLSGGIIKLAEGPNTDDPDNCSSSASDLTGGRVVVDDLVFKKFSQYPGHDTVSMDLSISYNSSDPQNRVSRSLKSAIARVSAATFDSDLLAGGSYNYSLGQAGSPWLRIFMADGTAAVPSYTFSGDTNTDTGFYRGGEDILRFVAGGADRLTVNSNGRIGVGTTTPQSLLDVAGSLYLKSNGTNSGELKVTYATGTAPGYYAVYAP